MEYYTKPEPRLRGCKFETCLVRSGFAVGDARISCANPHVEGREVIQFTSGCFGRIRSGLMR